MISEVAEKEFGLVGVGHPAWQFINSNCRGAGSDLAKEILYQPDASFRVVALERSRPGLVRTQTLSEPRQREDRLVERGVEQGVSDELRGAFALPHVFAILLVEAVREREQPSDLSDVLLHKGLFLLTNLAKENSEKGDCFKRLPADRIADLCPLALCLRCAQRAQYPAHTLDENAQGQLGFASRQRQIRDKTS